MTMLSALVLLNIVVSHGPKSLSNSFQLKIIDSFVKIARLLHHLSCGVY
jgi:hypothetical protein